MVTCSIQLLYLRGTRDTLLAYHHVRIYHIDAYFIHYQSAIESTGHLNKLHTEETRA